MVESKYKNPDKFIERLKKEVVNQASVSIESGRYYEALIKKLEEEKPEEVLSWRNKDIQEIHSNAVNSSMLKFRIGDTLIHEGEVKTIFADDKKTVLTVDFKRVLRKNADQVKRGY